MSLNRHLPSIAVVVHRQHGNLLRWLPWSMSRSWIRFPWKRCTSFQCRNGKRSSKRLPGEERWRLRCPKCFNIHSPSITTPLSLLLPPSLIRVRHTLHPYFFIPLSSILLHSTYIPFSSFSPSLFHSSFFHLSPSHSLSFNSSFLSLSSPFPLPSPSASHMFFNFLLAHTHRSTPRVVLERLAETSVDSEGVQLVDVDVIRIKSSEKNKKSSDREKAKHDDSSRHHKFPDEKYKKKKEGSGYGNWHDGIFL